MDDINNSPIAKKKLIEKAKQDAEHYYLEHLDSLIPFFENELREVGFEFEISNQTLGFMPKHKQVILPIAIKYYQLAREKQKTNEQNYFMSFFHFRGFNEVVPLLIEDFYCEETSELTRWFISDCLYQIRAKNFIKEYLDIVSNKRFGRNRQMVILLLGKLKEESAIPILIALLEDEEVRLHAINSLGEFKKEELRPCFEQFQNSTHTGWRKYARLALKKLDS